jgi:anti-sigma-K factor RskA
VNWSEPPPDCEHCVDAAAYILGALEDAEAVAYREHLEGCAICRQEIAQLQPAVDALPIAVAPVKAPIELRERLMATVQSEAELLRAAGSGADRPARARSRWRPRPLIGLVGASAALALGALLGAVVLSGESDQRVHVTTAEVTSANHDTTAVLRQVGSRSELDVADMAPPPPGRIYEVWLKKGNQAPRPTDALFSVTKAGTGAVDVPGDLHGVSQVLVTNEPLGGSSVPTRLPVIVVTLS